MAEDVWGILTVKVAMPLSTVVYHEMTLGGSSLLRASRALYSLFRDSRGRVSNRKMMLNDSIMAPTRLTNWQDVTAGIRMWKIEVAEHENITQVSVDRQMRANALLRMVPLDLRDRVLTQDGLEENYDKLRDYS